MARERRLFTEEFKREAVELVNQPGTTKAAIARDLGVGSNLLGRWCRDAVDQIRRYEAGTAQPTLDALIRLAKVLHVRLDDLVFGEDERGPEADLALQFEAVSQSTDDEKQTVRELLEGMILKHEARRWDTARTAPEAKAPARGAGRTTRAARR